MTRFARRLYAAIEGIAILCIWDDKPDSVMIRGNGEDTVCLRELLYVQLQRSAELMGIELLNGPIGGWLGITAILRLRFAAILFSFLNATG